MCIFSSLLWHHFGCTNKQIYIVFGNLTHLYPEEFLLFFLSLAVLGLSYGMWKLPCGMHDFQLRNVRSLVVAFCIQFPDQGSHPDPLDQKLRVLATGPASTSSQRSFYVCFSDYIFFCLSVCLYSKLHKARDQCFVHHGTADFLRMTVKTPTTQS